jgi:hypothetical protein
MGLRLATSKTFLALGILALAVGFAYHDYFHPMDFRVYYYGAQGVFDGTRPVYGPASGIGWPMHYRYPPLFLLLFSPLTLLPLGWAAAVWVVLKVGVLILLVRAISDEDVTTILPSVLFITPYIVEEFRYGNAQFFVFALTAAGLLYARAKPWRAAGSLALAISIKVWPLFFIPFLAARREWKVVSCTILFVLVLALVPSAYFGAAGNVRLVHQWFTQEFHTQLNENEIWFPNQSLRGVLMRYLTVVDYSQVPDTNYPQVNLTALKPTTVRSLWIILAGTIYIGFLFHATSRRGEPGLVDHALAFCLLALLEPFTQKYALAVLLWPALVSADFLKDGRTRILVYGAAVLALIQPLAPGANAQRLLQTLGLDFAAACLLTAGILSAQRTRSVATL